MLTPIATAIVIGIVGEASAYLLQLWVYRKPVYPVLNVVLMFGVVMGSLAQMAGALGLLGTFTIGFAIGVVYEIANFAFLNWWYFPGDRVYFLRGKTACVVGISVAWGLVPVAVAWVHGLA